MSLFSREHWGWLIPRAPEWRMYRRSVLPLVVFIVLMYAGLASIRGGLQPPWLRALIVLSPLVAYLWMFRIYLIYLRECDEFERRIELEAIAVGAMLVVFFLLGTLMLSAAKVLPTGFGMDEAVAIGGLLLCLGYFFTRYFLLWRSWR